MEYLTIILRIAHIFSAVFWVGSAWLSAFFLVPTARALGPDASKFMIHLITVRKLAIYIMAAAGTTIVAGWLLWLTRYSLPSLSTHAGAVFLLGGIVGTIAGVTGGMTGATSSRVGKLGTEMAGQGKPPTREQGAQMAALQKRLGALGLWTALLTSIALLLMVSARYI